MLRTKVQVDGHVSKLMKHLKSKDEKMARGFMFARLYFDINDISTAEEYLRGYLSHHKQNYAPAYKLLGQIYEKSEAETSQIINAYKKCFELDPNQKEILLKICELLADSKVTSEDAKFWAEKAEKHYPANAIVFKLKAKTFDMQQENSSNNNNEIKKIGFYEAESAKYPKDVTRKMHLLRLYVSGGMIDKAYNQIVDAEINETFNTSLDWYQCIVEVLSDYKSCKQKAGLTSEFYEFYLLALCLYASHSIGQSLNMSGAIAALWSLDQELTGLKDDAFLSNEPLKTILLEAKAHYIFLCGTLILNKAQKENLSWRTLSDPSFACFLASITRVPLNLKDSWFTGALEDKKIFLKRWYNLSCYRCSQIGHILRKKYDDQSGGDKWLKSIQDDFFHHVGRSRICHMAFSQYHSKESIDNSFILKSLQFRTIPNIPSFSDLEGWDGVVQTSQPSNLALLVWICLHYYDNLAEVQPHYPFALFSWLPYGCDKLDSFGKKTLSQLDVQTFLMATVRCAAQSHHRLLKLCDSYKPYLMPFAINETLCSSAQSLWWTAANKINMVPVMSAQDTQVLEDGLKVVRLIGEHGMNIELVSHLAKTWSHKADQNQRLDSTLDFSELDLYVDAHALHFWKRAMSMIQNLLDKQSIPTPRVSLFEPSKISISDDDLKSLLKQGQLFYALNLKGSNNFDDALRILKMIRSAKSFYEMALIFKEMAEDDAGISQAGESLNEGKSNINLLMKARGALKDALELAAVDSELERNIRLELDDIEIRLLNLQNFRDYEFVSEFPDDDTSFEGVKFCTPQKATNMKSAFIASSTPFTKKNKSDMESIEIRLGSLTHYVDQRFKNLSDDNQKLLERITLLENKIASLESQKMMWAPMPQMMHTPQAPLQFYTAGSLKQDPDVSGRMNHLMMDKFHSGMSPMQSGVVPGYTNPQVMTHLRPNLNMMDIYKSQRPSTNQLSGSFLSASGAVDADEYASNHEGILSSKDPNFFPNCHSASVAVTPKTTNTIIPEKMTFNNKTPKSVSQLVANSNSSLAKLLTPPLSISSMAAQKQVDFKNTSSPFNSKIPTGSSAIAVVPNVASVTKNDAPDVEISPSHVVPKSEHKEILGGRICNIKPITKSEKVPSTNVTHKQVPVSSVNPFSNFSFGDVGSKSPFKFSFNDVLATSSSSSATTVSIQALPLFAPKISCASVAVASIVPQVSSVVKANINDEVINNDESVDNEDIVEEYEASGEFKLVSLPIVNVVTGEEDSNRLFCERGKLYRMDVETKQWKERGVGDIKILENKTNKRVRILMRRDQVLKVCANHFINTEMKLKSMDTCENSFCWIAMDFAEEEMKMEQFCIKFKTNDIAAAFKECFELCQKRMDNPDNCGVSLETNAGTSKKDHVSLADQFKAKDGEWSCNACYVKNAATSTSCVSCETTKPGCENVIRSAPNERNYVSLADQFKVKDGEWSCNACYVKNAATSTSCVSCETTKPGCENGIQSAPKSESQISFGSKGGFQFNQMSSMSFGNHTFGMLASSGTPLFGSTSTVTQNTALSSALIDSKGLSSVPKFVFSTNQSQNTTSAITSAFNFNMNTPKDESKPVKEVSSFSFPPTSTNKIESITSKLNDNPSFFGTPDNRNTSSIGSFSSATSTFSFAGLSKASTSLTEPAIADDRPLNLQSAEDEMYKNVDGEDDHIKFEPIVKMPDSYEIKTLEENESIIYSEIAKIFRFHNNEWKEKGSGIVKLLKHEETGKVRILMRRDKIHKICCNHYISSDMQLLPLMNSKKALVWYAHDYVDGDQMLQQLCIKFKNEDHAEEFKRQFETVVNDLKSNRSVTVELASNEDCIITHVEEPESKLISESDRLLLPKSFYNYLNLSPCKGCIGCKEEEFQFSSVKDIKEEQGISLKVEEKPKKTSSLLNTTSVFGTLTSLSKKPANFTFESLRQSANDDSKNSTTFSFLNNVKETASTDIKSNENVESKAAVFSTLSSGTSIKMPVLGSSGKAFEFSSLCQKQGEDGKPKVLDFSSLSASFKSENMSSTPLSSLGAKTAEVTASSGAEAPVSHIPVFGSSGKVFEFSSFSKMNEKSNASLPIINNQVENIASSREAVFGSLGSSIDFASFSGSGFKSDSSFAWKGAGQKLFSDTTTSEKTQTSMNEEQAEDDAEAAGECDAHFEPIVNLPEIEVTTGEENEDEVYKQRSLLYRFDDGQWKERGVGDMRILRHRETGVYRLVMRREQIHKVVCNQLLSVDMHFKFMESSERALCWYANDFSEEARVEQFALKFKNVDLANEFLLKVETYQSEIRSTKH